MERMRAELARGVERYIFRRVAADTSPLLDDHTREILAEAIAWAVVHAVSAHATSVAHGEVDGARSRARAVALGR